MAILKDSGQRRAFETGSVRDVTEGKGRCDLLPLDVCGYLMGDPILGWINDFIRTGNQSYLNYAVEQFVEKRYECDWPTALLELAKHYQDGCQKYGPRNWEKGIPLSAYVDSGVRHYLKWRRGDNDEPHDRAFLWNMCGLLWTLWHKEETNDLPFKETDNG